MIEVFVESIRVNMTNYKRVVMLKEKAGGRYLPIWIGHFEADAIAIPMQNVPVSRPLTHDLLVGSFSQLGARCTHAAITRLADETFYAALALDQNGRSVELDCRPSDAISAAIRVRVPIYVEDEVMALAGMTFDAVQAASPTHGDGSSVVAEAESILNTATAARTGAPAADTEAEGSSDEPADDPANTVPYWPGAEPPAGPAPKPFDSLPAVSAPVLVALRSTALEAVRRRRPIVGPGDLLIGLLRQARSAAHRVLDDLSVQADELQTLARQELSRDYPTIALTPAAQAVLLRAIEEARRLDESTVGAEHLLLALAGESEGSIPTAFDKAGLSATAIRRQIAVLLAQAAEQDET